MIIKKLKKYFRLCALGKGPTKKELLSSNEALKQFGKLWGDDLKGDVMMMLAVIEQEFITNENFTDKEIADVKQVLGEVGKFFRACNAEWKEYEKTLEKR